MVIVVVVVAVTVAVAVTVVVVVVVVVVVAAAAIAVPVAAAAAAAGCRHLLTVNGHVMTDLRAQVQDFRVWVSPTSESVQAKTVLSSRRRDPNTMAARRKSRVQGLGFRVEGLGFRV